MSLWDDLSKAFKSGGLKKAMDVVNDNGGFKEVNKQVNNEYRKTMDERSSLKLGRMKESDCVKGENCKIPTTPGTYRHVNKETGAIDYVGDAVNLKKRQQEHARNGKLDLDTHKVQYGEAREDSSFAERRRTEQD